MTDNTMLPKGKTKTRALGNIVLSVVICQVLVLPLGNSVFSSHMSSSSLGLTFKVA
jgi:hypothetical protein